MPKVKICGITDPDDALHAADCGADALGFIFWKGSPRYVEPAVAARIVGDLPPFVTTVGVFVNEAPGEIRRVRGEVGLDVVQLHGEETPELCGSLGGRVIKAFRIKEGKDVEAAKAYRASAYLLDTFKDGVQGGTGETFDWDAAVEAKKFGRVILSGGLTPDNVADAIRHVRPYAVDVGSGVEKGPGRKDRDKVSKFIEEVKKA
ncbi:MAG: phosphoribosylanthranilate isomerase [Thermodesulfobacteriota bacterium]